MSTIRKRPVETQLELPWKTRGGSRPGAGRKRLAERPRVTHGERAVVCARHPLLVTLRLRDGLPRLRRPDTLAVVQRALAAGRERPGFGLNHFSVQSNHLHLIVEADDRLTLTRGLQGLVIRLARALNRHWSRSGRVLGDRYHERPLATPREVRNALVYVLQNARRHGHRLGGVDPYSSAAWFDGWRSGAPGLLSARASAVAEPVVPPRTWLQRTGWRRHGLVGAQETPASARQGRGTATRAPR